MDDVIHVLHVDDNCDLADLVSLYLERERDDLSVTSVFDAESALDELDGECAVDCVVTDYDMPGMDGVELLREIRSDHPDLPVILFTGKGNEEVASDAVSAGVTEYMQKGTNPEQYVVLANRIYNVATAYRTTQKLHNARQRYRQLVEHAPNAILVLQDGRVVFANRTVRAWSDASDILGARLERLVNHESLVTFRQTIRRALSRDAPVGWQPGRLNHQFDGRHVEFNAASIRHESRDAVQLVIRDVSDEHQRASTLEALLEATRELIEAEETDDVYSIIAETATDVLDLPHAAVWRYEADEAALVPVIYPDTPELPDEPPTFREGNSLSWDAFQAGETRVYDDLSEVPTHNEDTPIKSEVIVPIGRFGVLNAGATESASIPEQSASLAEVLTTTAAAVIASRQHDP